MWQEILNQFSWWTLLEVYLLWIIIYFLFKIIFNNTRMLRMVLFYIFVYLLYLLSKELGLAGAYEVFEVLVRVLPYFIVVIAAPDIRLVLESMWKAPIRKNLLIMGSERTKSEIIKAAFNLSKRKTGALITIEKHHSLDQFSNNAIIMNSDISREVLENIFTPNSPLHDGAVIIRGDKILCAGAYFTLSSNETFEKTTGSRHRAALGISEITDSFTVVVSEETGKISLASNGILTPIKDEESLTEYLNLFMR